MPVREILAQVRDLGDLVRLEDRVDNLHDLLILLPVGIVLFVSTRLLQALGVALICVALIQHAPVKWCFIL